MRLQRIIAVLVALMVTATASPAVAQKNPDKAANRAAKQAAKLQTPVATPDRGASTNVAAANGGAQKALPNSGGLPIRSTVLLGAGSLLAGSGLLIRRRLAKDGRAGR